LNGPLIDAAALHELLAGSQRPALLDVRWELGGRPGREAYAEGHIPGAVFVDLECELAAPPGEGGRHPMPGAKAFEASMRSAGVDDARPVIVYDAATSMAAARAWWLLRYFGHHQVAVLDGGLAAWSAAGYELSTAPPEQRSGDFIARPGGMPLLDAAAAAALASQGVLLDARAPARFRGELEPIDPVAGHIPGARSRPSSENIAESGRFRDAATLRRGFERLGVENSVGVGAYCGSGVTAAHEVLALELAGYPAALYLGSWSDWITDPARPVARGS
jgi:thiosulfate/3-mercaptopyruvate sulfurtransferase